MSDPSPYAPPKTLAAPPERQEGPPGPRLWLAFAVTPPIMAVLMAVFTFIVAAGYLLLNPEDVEVNSLGILVAPIFVAVIGVAMTYTISAVIWMPLMFAFKATNRLNAPMIFATASGLAAMMGTALVVLDWLTYEPEAGVPIRTDGQILVEVMTSMAIWMVLANLFAFVFWRVGVRQR